MPHKLFACMSLPPATTSSVPISDFAIANEEFNKNIMEQYYTCCGKSICAGCVHSSYMSGHTRNCPFCKAQISNKTDEEEVAQVMKRAEANDADSMMFLAYRYYYGTTGLQQDREKAMELFARAAKLGSSQAHFQLGNIYKQEGDTKKAKFHYEAAAMAGHEGARTNLGTMEYNSGKRERAVKHWIIAASAGAYNAMH
jgi:TPR repeat protein